ncbi:Bax inhibitor-1/YccA family protein [Aurantiacibacter luteus]|uniref:Membrane protein n=1 Tax=Aurantiacibacter luteus TaxID=1581420 RepID=A0A0G9MSY7_9SPHN|nr:Bax inhibitor-1/YccA family protein [Aurantiacibacter luteus]KLE33840.1 membrane protein [Aurantiacibacter luteus]
MANWNENRTRQGFGTAPGQMGDVTSRTTMDAGLRGHMLSIYNYMASGVLLTGIVALLTWQSGLAAEIMTGPMRWIVALSPLAIVFAMSFGRDRFSTGTLQLMFWAFAVLMGLSLSSVFAIYTGASIATTFFATASGFAALSLWGYTTKKDISGWGSFLIVGVIGLLVAMIANMFIQSSGLAMAIPFIGVLIFAGLTAYDTQRLKHEYLMVRQAGMTNPAVAAAYPVGKMVILGALTLYLDFVNMFTFLLQFMGSRE